VDHNEAFKTFNIPFEVGTPAGGAEPRYIRDARFDHNRSVGSGWAAYLVQRAESVQLDHNIIEEPARSGVEIRGESRYVTVSDNQVSGGPTAFGGVAVVEPFADTPEPSAGVVFVNNTVRGFLVGVWLGFNAKTTGTQVLNNVTENNQVAGILVGGTNTRSLVQGNVANHNQFGIRTGSASATDNRIVGNSMHRNTGIDAFESSFTTTEQGITLNNTWQKNQCDTDSPPGTICGR
jgi:hypothetical protein